MGLIRTLLALSVVFWHSALPGNFVFVGGENAVRLFYIASGYLISLVLTGGRYTSIRAFYVNRWLRIWPIYAVAASACFGWGLLVQWGYINLYHQFPKPMGFLAALSNFTLIGQDWLFFTHHEPPPYILLVNQPSWTLAVELSFYIVAPFVLRRRAVLVATLAASVVLRLALMRAGHSGEPWSYRFFPNELAWFLCGAVSQQMLAPLYRRWLGDRIDAAAAAGTIALLLLIGTFHLFHWPELAGAALLVVVFVLLVPLAVEFQARRAWDRRIGDLSYPIYISHYLLLMMSFTFSTRTGITAPEALTAFVFAGTLVLAWGLNRFVGEPIEGLRRKVKSRQPVPVASQDEAAYPRGLPLCQRQESAHISSSERVASHPSSSFARDASA